jgi:hypothetical protein
MLYYTVVGLKKIKMYYTEEGLDVKHASWAGVQD